MFRKAVTVVALFAAIGLLGLLQMDPVAAGHSESIGVNAEAMAIFGFIVLAAFMLADLAETIHLPHITGYLLTGVLCGPYALGLLDHAVIEDLKHFDDLAVALIALSAGAALTIDTLKKGAKLLTAVLGAQFFFSLLIVGGVVILCSGVIPGFALPFLVDAPWGFKIAAALCLGLVASAMSPAATMAVVHETKSKGKITDAVLSVSILNNVVVVVLFALGLSLAGALAPEYYVSDSDNSIAITLLTSIGGAGVLGAVLGFALAYYVRYLGHELLLVMIGICFSMTYVAEFYAIDPVLAFLVAGFVARNAFPKEEVSLSRVITKLSLPVYVLFFFLAGAGLHVDYVIKLWAFALLLFGARLLSLYIGTRVGNSLGNGPEGLSRFGWLGFGAQAGIALSMAKILGESFGATGKELETIAVAGIALNELCGPILLKVCLGIAGETGLAEEKKAPTPEPEPLPALLSEETEEAPPPKITEWLPEPHPGQVDPWADTGQDEHKKITRLSRNLRAELQSLTREVQTGPVANRRKTGEDFIAQLRREFLRFHRRCMVFARDPELSREAFLSKLSSQRAQLAARWQDHILDRSALADYRNEKIAIDELIRAVDNLVAGMPSFLVVPLDAELIQSDSEDATALRLKKWWKRVRVDMSSTPPVRTIEVEKIGRFTLGSDLCEPLEQVAALLAVTDRHLMSRARNIFEVYRKALSQAVKSDDFQPGSWDTVFLKVREEMEEEFSLAFTEVDRLADESVRATAFALAQPYHRFMAMIRLAGTPHLSRNEYRASQVYNKRLRALKRIDNGLLNAKNLTRSVGNGLAMELELVRLQTRVRSLIQDGSRDFTRDLQGRAIYQTERIQNALNEMLVPIGELLSQESIRKKDLEQQLKDSTEDFAKLLQEAKGISASFLSSLESESALEPLRLELSSCIDMVKERFLVAESQPSLNGRGLPETPETREIPFRRLVHQYMDAEVSRGMSGLLKEIGSDLRKLQTSLDELERALTYNSEVSLAEIEVIEEDIIPPTATAVVREMFFETLERHSKRLHEERIRCEPLNAKTEDQIYEIVVGHLESLQRLLIESRFDEMEVELAKAKAYARRSRRDEVGFQLSDIGTATQRLSQSVLGEAGTRKLKNFLGIPEIHKSQGQAPEHFEPPKPISEIPVVYHRIFQDASLEARDLLADRDAEINRIQAHILGKSGRASRSSAVIAEGATNVSALLQGVARGLSQELKILRYRFTSPVTPEDIEEIRQAASGECLILIEDLRWFIELQPGGLQGLRLLAETILADRGHNAWLVGCEASAWEYIEHHLPLEGVFPEKLHIQPLDQNDIQRAILDRHGMSGFTLEFDELETSILWRLRNKIRKKDTLVNLNEALVFEAITFESGGNLRDALHLWLASVTVVSSLEDQLRIGRPPRLPLEAVRSLDEHSLLCLRQFARQGRLSAAEHALHFQQNRTASESQLAKLAHLGLIESTETDHYLLSPRFEGCIYRVLREKELAG